MAAVTVSRSERGRTADAVLRRGRWRLRWTGSVSGCALTAEFADIARREPVRMPGAVRWFRDRRESGIKAKIPKGYCSWAFLFINIVEGD